MISHTKDFITDIYTKRSILYELAKRDFQQKYMGSYLGAVWVYLQPLLMVLVMYLVFKFGFKSGHTAGGVSFVSYLICGIVAWYYFSDNLNSCTNVIKENDFLLKKVDFRLSMLPIVKLLSSTLPHAVLLIIAIILTAFNGVYPSLHLLELLYYFAAMIALLLGIGWLTSSTNIFAPDVSQLIGVLVTFGFWLTPVFWDISRIPEKYRWIIHLNPAEYIVNGYRDAIIGHVWFWEKPFQTLYFWTFTLLTMWIGIKVFQKLRPHFAEVV